MKHKLVPLTNPKPGDSVWWYNFNHIGSRWDGYGVNPHGHKILCVDILGGRVLVDYKTADINISEWLSYDHFVTLLKPKRNLPEWW